MLICVQQAAADGAGKNHIQRKFTVWPFARYCGAEKNEVEYVECMGEVNSIHNILTGKDT